MVRLRWPNGVVTCPRETLQDEVLKQVKYGTKVYTDDAVAYDVSS